MLLSKKVTKNIQLKYDQADNTLLTMIDFPITPSGNRVCLCSFHSHCRANLYVSVQSPHRQLNFRQTGGARCLCIVLILQEDNC